MPLTRSLLIVICCIFVCLIVGCIFENSDKNNNDELDSVYELPIYDKTPIELKSKNVTFSTAWVDENNEIIWFGFVCYEEAKITLAIKDNNNDEVKTIVDEFLSAGSHAFYWDLNNEYSEFVSEDIYRAVIMVNNEKEISFRFKLYRPNYDAKQYKEILTDVEANPNLFSPNGDEENDYTVLEFTMLKVEGNVKITIYNSHCEIIRTLYDGILSPRNYLANNSLNDYTLPGYWNGKDNDGNIVSTGQYYFTIIASTNEWQDIKSGYVYVH